MTLPERFLILFQAYRDLRDEVTRKDDEILQLRGQLEDERKRANDVTERLLNREEKITDQFIGARIASVTAQREAQTATFKPEEISADEWKKKAGNTFREALKARQATLQIPKPNEPGQDTPRPN